MRLTVLGGAAAGGNPGQGCSGYLIEVGRTHLVLDLGPGTLPELRRHCDVRQIEAIVVSHLHLDHVLDLLALRFLLAYNPIPRTDRLPVWLPPGGLAFLERAASGFAERGKESEFFAGVIAAREYDPTGSLTIGDAALRFAAAVHYVPCWAIRVQERASERALLYSADTGPAADLTALGTGAEIAIVEATLLDAGDEPFAERGHLTAGEAGRLATAIGAKTLVLTHLWDELGLDRYRSQASAAFSGRVVLAEPGVQVTW
jgi:ribonuclease BN (tRNA processing enzyme)